MTDNYDVSRDLIGIAYDTVTKSKAFQFNDIDIPMLHNDVDIAGDIVVTIRRYREADKRHQVAKRRLDAAKTLDLDLESYSREHDAAEAEVIEAANAMREIHSQYTNTYHGGWKKND